MANNEENKSKLPWGDIRKIVVLLIITIWVICYFYNFREIDENALNVLFVLVIVYISDLLFSIILSAKASEIFKSFMFQTFVPISALSLVSFLSFHGSIDSSTTLSLFGLSLGYTTYVVGKKLKKDNQDGGNGKS